MKQALQGILTALCLLIFPALGLAQGTIHLKTRDIVTNANASIGEIASANPNTRNHLVLQFATQPSASVVTELQNRGVNVLADVPSNSLLVSVQGTANLAKLGVNHAAALGAADKISPLIGATGAANSSIASGYYVVEFYSDADMNQARSALLAINGVNIMQNPDLNPLHILIQILTPNPPSTTQAQVIAAVTSIEDVAYVFPASKALANNTPSAPCVGALTTNGASVQSVPTYGNGWDGPGLGSAALTFVYSKLTAQLPAASQQSEIQRAMAVWSSFVQVTWHQGTNSTGAQTVNILFATGAHGDPYPFDGPGGVLAHTFYPAPPNPEPLAGDMHFDDSESWHIGTDTDLFSVALHELGHSLGLGHSDNPSDVMYPYYRMVKTLNSGDISAVQTLYATQVGAPVSPVTTLGSSSTSSSSSSSSSSSTSSTSSSTSSTGTTSPGVTVTTPGTTPAATPLTLSINSTALTTTASTFSLSGSAKGGTGAIAISWTTNAGAYGGAGGTAAAWTIASIPLNVGVNTITVTAATSTGKTSQTITVTRTSTTTGSTTSTTTPTTTGTKDTTPPTLTILSPSASLTSTTTATYTVAGVASDNVGVARVIWSTPFGAAGTATGTTNWSANIPVLVGINTILIQASDAAGNVTTRSVIITRH